MAAPPQGDSSYHPEPRCGAASFTIGRKLFMFRGFLKSYQHKNEVEFPRAVEVFDAETLVWNNVDSVGDHPPWHHYAAVTTCKNNAFFFGGNRGATGFCNDLFALNSTNMSFRQLPGGYTSAAYCEEWTCLTSHWKSTDCGWPCRAAHTPNSR